MAILSFSIINFKPCIPKKYIPDHCSETRECNWINGALFMCDDGDFCSPITLAEPLYFPSPPKRWQTHFDPRIFSESSLLFESVTPKPAVVEAELQLFAAVPALGWDLCLP